jgi:hypothetical protein
MIYSSVSTMQARMPWDEHRESSKQIKLSAGYCPLTPDDSILQNDSHIRIFIYN